MLQHIKLCAYISFNGLAKNLKFRATIIVGHPIQTRLLFEYKQIHEQGLSKSLVYLYNCAILQSRLLHRKDRLELPWKFVGASGIVIV